MSAFALVLNLVVVALAFASLVESLVVVVPPSSAPATYSSRLSPQSKVLFMLSSSLSNDDKECSQRPSNVVDEAMHSTYSNLASRIIERYQNEYQTLRNAQLFIGIAGGPGAGKSTLATAVAKLINERMMPMQQQHRGEVSGASTTAAAPAAVVLPMDGFHYSRSQLKTMGEEDTTNNNAFTYDELLARRGAPWTFDADGCINAFTLARIHGYANLPIYCRKQSDPISNGVQLHSQTKIVLLEGNYLLCYNDVRWKPLQTNQIFDETWYITCNSISKQRDRLIQRHLETWTNEKSIMFGEGEVGAGIKADQNDMKNLLWIEEMGSRMYADYIIESI
jgi:pantothenate kinase